MVVCPRCNKDATKMVTENGIYYWVCKPCKRKTIEPSEQKKLRDNHINN